MLLQWNLEKQACAAELGDYCCVQRDWPGSLQQEWVERWHKIIIYVAGLSFKVPHVILKLLGKRLQGFSTYLLATNAL